MSGGRSIVSIPRVVIAGTHSGVGKTTLATGIMAALTQRGRSVQGYKIGPDYIDPTFHALATGRPSRNLDRWLLGDHFARIFARTAKDHWAVIEGVMGLFDGMSGTQGFGSTADVAKELNAPVILVVDAINMSRSAAALVHGFCTFDPEVKIQGVILNRVKSSSQEKLLREAMAEIEVPIVGAVPKEEALHLPERHLGLVPSQERKFQDSFWEDLYRIITKYIDLDQLEKIMLKTSDYLEKKPTHTDSPITKSKSMAEPISEGPSRPRRNLAVFRPRLGIARDEAFSFYYQDALEEAEALGFTLIPFSPLHDSVLPDHLDGIFLGGGFPELHLEELSRNHSFRQSLQEFADSGKAIYAECGGYMYLGESVKDFEGKQFPMVSIIPMKAEMTSRLQGLGYRAGILAKDTFFGSKGTAVQGHEFHYSQVQFRANPETEGFYAYRLFKTGKFHQMEGYAKGNVFGSYLHLNFAGYPELWHYWKCWMQDKGVEK
ncbi:cobyrinate a [Desulfitobacterium sp. AusDCA]